MVACIKYDSEIQALAACDRNSAFELMVNRYQELLFARACFITKDTSVAEEIVQDTFLKAMRETRIFEPDFRIKGWLQKVCLFAAYNHVRDRKSRADILDCNKPQHYSPAAQASRANNKRRSEMLEIFLSQLSENHRAVLELYYWMELEHNEIAVILDIKLGTVCSRLGRARARLRHVCEGDREFLLSSI